MGGKGNQKQPDTLYFYTYYTMPKVHSLSNVFVEYIEALRNNKNVLFITSNLHVIFGSEFDFVRSFYFPCPLQSVKPWWGQYVVIKATKRNQSYALIGVRFNGQFSLLLLLLSLHYTPFAYRASLIFLLSTCSGNIFVA